MVSVNYGEALFELAKEENKLQLFKDQLKEINKIVKKNNELQTILMHPKIDKMQKKEIIKKVFDNDSLILNFMMFLVDRSRISYFSTIVEVVIEKINQELGIEIAYVSSAVELAGEEKVLLINKLSKKFNKDIELICTIDKSALAGIKVQVRDEVIDNTLKAKLTNIKESVAKATLSS